MNKTNNKICSLREFDYNEEKKELIVKYRNKKTKTYLNFSKAEYEILVEANQNNKLLMPVLKKLENQEK